MNSATKRLLAGGVGGILLLALATSCKKEPEFDFFRDRRQHQTAIPKKRQAPSAYDAIKALEWLETFEYASSGLKLSGYRAHPTSQALARNGKVPALLYLHGGFAVAKQDVIDVISFLRAGFAVYAPAYRGENGNPGHYELFFGELDDARAALEAMTRDPRIDPKRIIVLGHSAGGVLASLMTFESDLPVIETASIGGIYTAQVFDFLELPFVDSEQERRVRLFLPSMRQMKVRHFACVGLQDNAVDATRMAAMVAENHQLPFEMQAVEGDHVASLEPCVDVYLQRAKRLMK